MEPDYPCAHSMDAHWFAVDRDGHVASFKSGEAGAVPAAAFAPETYPQTHEQLAQLRSPCEVIHDPQGRLRPGPHGRSGFHRPSGNEHPITYYVGSPFDPAQPPQQRTMGPFPILMFLDSLEPVQDAIAAGLARQVPAAQGVAVLWTRLTDMEHGRLHRDNLCRGCDTFLDEYEDMPPNLGRYGFFVYDHLTENWISGPYGREQQPARPIHIDELPPELRRQMRQLTYDHLRFTETPHIQPVEFGPCESWEAAWMDVTGKKIRPMPGREEDYADAYEELAEDGEFEVEPPEEE